MADPTGTADPSGAVFVDLDRTLLGSASGPVLQEAMVAEGVLPGGRHVPGEGLLYRFYNRFGESVPSIGLARAAAPYMQGRQREATRRAGKRAVEPLVDLVQPWALEALQAHRAAGLPIVLATTSPFDLVSPLAEALGFDDVIATRYAESGGRYTGRLEGGFVWGLGKRTAVGRWAADHGIDLRASHAYTDSVFDLPLLMAVGHPHPLNADPRLTAVALARRWPLEYWDRPPGIPSLVGFEPYHLVRPFFRPQAFPYARFDLSGLEHIPTHGAVLLASNHRSYFDVVAIGMVAARLGRPVRFLAKQEVFDAPVVGPLARSLGGIAVERGAGSSEPMRRAAAALRAGEVVIVLPQGTIPRGEAFFDPVLHGHTGTARLAAETGAPVVPIGLWGTERVWPRSSKVPNVTTVPHPPRVTVTVGAPVPLGLEDAVADTTTLMGAIAALLPDESRVPHIPTEEDLARTRPSA
jgi:putative phosphoserine phosphatase/1-acylglycerol-3-phosphate O-acyltransferase